MSEHSFPPPVRFGIWSDSQVAAEDLQARLLSGGQQAVIARSQRSTGIEFLVVLARRPLTPTEQATITSLFNLSSMTIAVEPPGYDTAAPAPWPRDVSLRWTGRIDEVGMGPLATDLINLVRPAGMVFSRLPMLHKTRESPPEDGVVGTREKLLERLTQPVQPRVVRVTESLWADLRAQRPAESQVDYELRRLAAWSAHEHSRSFVNLRLTRPQDRTVAPRKPLSLSDVINDPLTRPLVLLLGEPGSGKTLQLSYYDAQAALSLLRQQPGRLVAPTFYVALADQPARSPDISVAWLAQRWKAAVDTSKWCDFYQFLGDGGTVLLDGLNEGGQRGLEPERWMSQWRDVIQALFESGAGKVVVSCRTRDQVVRMNVPRDRQPSSVTILPLSQEEIIAIATEKDVAKGRQLTQAFSRDPGLIGLYSSSFALKTFLESGTPWVATTGARLIGAGLAAAITREWDHDIYHGPLVPGTSASRLDEITEANRDPWPELEMIPLIQALSQLAKELTLPSPLGSPARRPMSRREIAEFLTGAIHRITGHRVSSDEVVKAATDLHILQPDEGSRYTHPSVQHLFAALGCEIDELFDLAERERDRPSIPSIGVAPGEARHRFDEVFRFAAQLRGTEVPDRLLLADPVLAAHVYATIRSQAPDDGVRDRIVEQLRAQLDTMSDPAARAEVLAALGDLGWTLPSAANGDRNATMLVPPGTWRLGGRSVQGPPDRHVYSEIRTMELPQFRISRFPVSNAEYAEFIDAGGYADRSLWTVEGWQWLTRHSAAEQFVEDWQKRQARLRQTHPAKAIELLRNKLASPAGAAALVRFATMSENEMFEYAHAVMAKSVTAPRFWRRKALGNPLQPVVGVSWFEANAYCAWLSRRLGAVVRLPNENEWEAACLRSWGLTDTDEIEEAGGVLFGNTQDTNWQATTPIGAFGTHDQTRDDLAVELMGNVFEWLFDYYAAGDHGRRVVKGGSWRHETWRAHPAYRGRGDVAAQNDDVGFRYVIREGPP
ncbi:SUMF1/EgtB/PvdO family nonheme iron enzyme [Actinoplanes sp. NPDC051343]|uniref:SUMF1/EgtB/PvdO family nonheme iron enzyme n=1 Tax=Actinoplanes sp. NPDC051343 TaxID=3363906 RepID=UPI0037912DB7